MSEIPAGQYHSPGRYEIRLKGHLEARWAAWFDGLTVTRDSDGTTILHGPVADQAALHGLLQKTRDLAAQLTNADWFASVPGTEAQKGSIRGCTHCHTLERIVRTRYDVDRMMAVIERMSTYPQLSFPFKIQKLPAPRIGGGQESPEQRRAGWRRQAEYLTTINLSGGPNGPTR